MAIIHLTQQQTRLLHASVEYNLSSKRFDGLHLYFFLLYNLFCEAIFVTFLLVYFIPRYTHFKYLVIVNFIILCKLMLYTFIKKQPL